MEIRELVDQVEALRSDNISLRDELSKSEMDLMEALCRAAKAEGENRSLKAACKAAFDLWAEELDYSHVLTRAIKQLLDILDFQPGGKGEDLDDA